MDSTAVKPFCLYNSQELELSNYIPSQKLQPILKWAGGKEQELKYIIPNLPKFNNYYEPFVGGGAVYTALQANKYFINDKSEELILLYETIINSNRELFFQGINEIIHNWNLLSLITKNNDNLFLKLYKEYSKEEISENQLKNFLFEFILKNADQFNGMFSSIFNFNIENFIREIKVNLIRKIKRMKVLEKIKGQLPDKDILDNIETAFKSAFYMHFRHIYNNTAIYNIQEAFKSAIFLFIRNFAYSGMFRYNLKGDFNVPYGGIGYNNKNIQKKVDYLFSSELEELLTKTKIENLDFADFLNLHEPQKEDFLFLDPPYDTEFSTYAKNEFGRKDQERLANYLITNCKAQWMMIIKNTDFIFSLYNGKGLNIRDFEKKYLVSFMNRNDKNVTHLIITNY